MKVPCSECIVKARCMLRIQVVETQTNRTYYFIELLRECEQLREYFEVNTLQRRIKLNGAAAHNLYGDDVAPHLRHLEDEEKRMDAFLRVMHKPLRKKEMTVKNVRRRK
jgi:hypothetical protein